MFQSWGMIKTVFPSASASLLFSLIAVSTHELNSLTKVHKKYKLYKDCEVALAFQSPSEFCLYLRI